MVNVIHVLDMGLATIYAKTHLRIDLNRNYGIIYPSSESFLVIRIQKVCGKTILMCIIPIFVGL